MSKAFAFISYFIKYIFHSKTKQRLIYLTIVGLFLSSMSLIILQGIMQGLQGKMIRRSKFVSGDFILNVKEDLGKEREEQLLKSLQDQKITFYPEYELELLVQNETYISPVILRGIDTQYGVPAFLQDSDLEGVVLGADLSSDLKASILSEITFYSPSHSNELFGNVPRMLSDVISDLLITDVTEVDSITAWTRISFVQNLTRERVFNRIRFYENSIEKVQKIIKNLSLGDAAKIVTWEEMNPSLLWAFKLETLVIVSLFVCMCALVSLTIVSGNLIFFNQIKFDLVSFWILGLSRKVINWLIFLYFQLKTVVTCILGIVCGGGVLWWLKNYAPEIMPDVFLERSLPVEVNFSHLAISFFVPYGVSTLFSFYALYYFNKENTSYVEQLKSVGE
ncbi:MAG: ABC transporter permease [Halobacteriovoraceae bacterium]|nr:ABC transporter permease [Halobacteriovoraceae bacterium]MCB9095726.1 ABC transporter permease [Halobacteriovoraceae bacterium]